jgi:hypothetical protein
MFPHLVSVSFRREIQSFHFTNSGILRNEQIEH